MEKELLLNLELTPYHFNEIIKKGFSLDMIYFLKLIKSEEAFETEGIKVSHILSTMRRKGLLTEEDKITVEGENLLNFLSSDIGVKFVKKKPGAGAIDVFWKIFPARDTFEYKGRKFEGARSLRTAKDDCREKLESILNEGEYTSNQVMAAIEYDITMKKEQSVKTGKNNLTYLQNSLTYLRQRSFEPFIGLELKVTSTNQQFDGVNI